MTLDLLARYGGGILAVVACFGFIIFIHELGHFLVARRVGIRCPEFAIGFGAKLFKFRWRATEFSLRAFPFGGFVLMTGEEPDHEDSWHNQLSHYLLEAPFPARPAQLLAYLDGLEAGQPDLTDTPESQAKVEEIREHLQYSEDRVYTDLNDVEGNFNCKSIPARIAVVIGGVVMNFIAALLLFWSVGLVWGVADAAPVAEPRLAEIHPGPAKVAGFQANDVIIDVNGQAIVSGSDMIKEISKYPGVPIHIKVQRGKEVKDFPVTPNVSVLGIIFEPDGDNVKVLDVVVPDPTITLEKGDVVKSVEGESFRGLAGFAELVRRQAPEKKLALQLASGESRELVTRSAPFNKLEPEGKIGVVPGTPTHIVIVSDAVGQVIAVKPGSPGEKAGFQAGDGIASINDRNVFGQADISQVLAAMEGKEVTVQVARKDDLEELTFVVPPGGFSELGLTLQPVDAAFVFQYGLTRLGRLVVQPYHILYDVLTKPRAAGEVRKQIGGPLMIMTMIYDISSHGLPTLLFFLALLNAAVGAFNLLPFPALDGSRLFFLVLALIRRKEMDPDKEARIHYVGLIVLLALVALISVQDVGRLFSGTQLIK